MSGGVAAQLRKLCEELVEWIEREGERYDRIPDKWFRTQALPKEVQDTFSAVLAVLAKYQHEIQDIVSRFPTDLTEKHDNLELVPLCEFWGFHNDTLFRLEELKKVLGGGVEATVSDTLKKLLKEGKTTCLSCGYKLQPNDELYEGYGCPKCESPLVVKVEAT